MYRQASWSEPLLSELSVSGRRGARYATPAEIREAVPSPLHLVPATLRRSHLDLPELSEPQVVRHFHRLSQMNYGVDSGPYPLGSCTMKYNPKIGQRLAQHAGVTRVHPYQSSNTAQGLLEILYRLAQMLAEITGMNRFSLAPAAGAQAEYVGVLIMRAFQRDRREDKQRVNVLIPDSAHGTNPASAAMAGFQVVKIPSTSEGLLNLDAVKGASNRLVAGMMLTVPNTLGLFERDVLEAAQIVHEAGGLMYYDGANLNALLGRVRPGDIGFDIVHVNVHKTFSTPHGGGGPGAGPVGVVRQLTDYLPVPLVDFDKHHYVLNYQVPKTIGRIRGFIANVGVLLRTYLYIRSLGPDGLRQVSGQAVLAANYLRSQLDPGVYETPHENTAPPLHEFVVSARRLRESTNVRAEDIAKALLDYGLHAPSTYFPLIVDEALMIEPTETEPLEALQRYAQALNALATVSRSDPDRVRSAPRNTTVSRLDDVKASHPRTMTLTWRKMRNAVGPGPKPA